MAKPCCVLYKILQTNQVLISKESPELIIHEYQKLEHEIENLNHTRVELPDIVFVIKPVLVLSMID